MKKRLSSQFKVDSHPADFTSAELHKLRSLKTPLGIQRALDKMPYHVANTAWSPRRVLAENSAHGTGERLPSLTFRAAADATPCTGLCESSL